MTLPQDERQILSAVAAAIADGKSAGAANLADGRSNLEKAAEYIERFDKITDEAVDQTVAAGKDVTLANLEKTAEEIAGGDAPATTDSAQDTIQSDNTTAKIPANITARRQLEEIRLMMTVEVNRKLIGSGYAIDTTELEELVNTLRQLEERQRRLLFGETDTEKAAEKAALYNETRSKVEELPICPLPLPAGSA